MVSGPLPPSKEAAAGPARASITDARRSLMLVGGMNTRQRLVESLWQYVGQALMSVTFHDWYGMRRGLLRLFGARVANTARIRPSVRISHPWHLTIGEHTAIGDHAILFCLGPITIGDRCTISQYSHLCAGSHDYTKRDMPLITRPIVIENDVWIAADVFVGPGVTIGTDTVVGARSTVLHSLPPKFICAGDAARPMGPRKTIQPQAGPPGAAI